MPKKITPQQVAMSVDWNIPDAVDFCADVLEDCNDHNTSLALRAVNLEDFELACDFIMLEKEQSEAGELTGPLRKRRDELLERLHEAEEAP